jgi:peroxiredoxin
MARAAQFEKSYPQSSQLRQVHDAVKQSLSMAFGYIGFPIPPARVAEVECCTKELLRIDGKDDGLHTVLFRIAENLPVSQERTRLQELSREATSGATCSKVKTALRNLDRLGQPVELSFTAVDGHNVSLTALRGKVVVIDFWAPSCGPCVRDFPKLKELYSKYQAQGLEVLGISIDPDERDLSRFLEKHPLPWPVKYDGNESKQPVAQTFGIEEIPVVWLVDRRGVLRDLKGREDQEKKIEALLKEQ